MQGTKQAVSNKVKSDTMSKRSFGKITVGRLPSRPTELWMWTRIPWLGWWLHLTYRPRLVCRGSYMGCPL